MATDAWLQALCDRVEKLTGFLPRADIEALVTAAMAAQPGTWVEVGSYHGKSSILLGELLRKYHPGQVLYCIDPHKGERGAKERITTDEGTLDAWYANINRVALRNACWPHIGTVDDFPLPTRITFAFIDALHDRESVLHDARALLPAMDAGCLMAFHDYGAWEWPGVGEAVQELTGKGGPLAFQYAAGTVAVCEVR